MSLELKKPQSVQFPDSWKAPKTPGYGTYPGSHRFEGIERYEGAVLTAIRNGYRHIDSAQTYDNEFYVGQAIHDSGVPRKEIFLTSKLHPSKNSRQGAIDGIEESRSVLKSYLDLFLIHYPGEGEVTEAWKSMIEAKYGGLCKHIGVSNFEIKHIEKLLRSTDECPEVNQIEFHPLLYSKELINLVQHCKENGIQVEGYCLLAWGDKLPDELGRINLLENDAVKKIADKHRISSSQVIIKWCMQHGVRPIVGTLKEEHISENAGPYVFRLSQEEMKSINALGEKQLRLSLFWGWDPPNAKMH